MKWFFKVLLLMFSGYVLESTYSFSYHTALHCKEYQCIYGYTYKTYFKVSGLQRRRNTSDPSVIFELHLAILAASNGHILLSTVPMPTANDPVYEIVIGGGGNRFTELRRNLKRNAKVSSKTIGVLSPIDFRDFYIKITEDGLIEFGRENELLPILSYLDSDPITVKFFSFAAWSGVEAKFLYDCPTNVEQNHSIFSEKPPDTKRVEARLSNSDRLKRILLQGKEPLLPPEHRMTVSMRIKITSVAYDAFESKLSTGIALVLKWTDNSMAWNPSKFNGTSTISLRQGQIWTPEFHVFNSDSPGMIEAKSPEMITMVNSGEATFHLQTVVHTWCYDYNTTYTRWPRDVYECSIVIQPWEAHDKIDIQKLTGDQEINAFADVDEVFQGAWELEKREYVVLGDVWNSIYPTASNKTHQSDRYIIKINIKRHATAYNIAFYTPLLILMTFVLLSFYSEPVCLSRIWFYSCCSIIICIGMCFIDNLVPSHTIPTVLLLYTVLLCGVLLALLIQTILMTSVGKVFSNNSLVQKLLRAQYVRYIFGLPVLKACRIYETINEGFSRRDDEDTESDLVSSRNEDLNDETAEHSSCKDLAIVFDKTMFVVYSITFAVMLGLHF
ncbi:neuronal acetylcholine receptor subunit alpha-5-like isoform X1 [Leptidea sinapis]|uniref:neuronal acetylcholine receptor subunit alpha-5-like isoform X1 n=1 Tax=Leptidea sinapis TaxID=189913 RepID=UPI00212E05B0|nr:neuronal acetylcholine receptor subunit alpha-5-like isoform X1 [Leptidea sinapis]